MPGELPEGLYEALVTRGLAEKLAEVDPRVIDRRRIHRAEVPDRFALHLARAIEKSLQAVSDTDRVSVGLDVLESVLDVLAGLSTSDVVELERLAADPAVLTSVSSVLPDGTRRPIVSPLISLLDTTLLTNAPNEPRVGHQIHAEIGSANNIDVLMAFVRRSGIAPMRSALAEHCERGGRLRLLTTTYTNSTEREALDVLTALGAVHLHGAHRGADDVDAVQRGFSGDVLDLAREGERVVLDRQIEVLGDLVLVDDLAHAHADLVAPLEFGRLYPGLDLRQVALGGAQQRFALVGAKARELRIAAGHQSLPRIVR